MSDSAGERRKTRLRARTFASRLEDLAEDFVSRDEVMRVLGLAILCREHVLLIGPPGTAKTLLVDRFRRLLEMQYFSYLLTRFTEPAELFGPMDIDAFRRQHVFRINTTGMLPQAELAFLDEVFQGSSAILNTLLTLINERKFHNGQEVKDVPLVTLVGSTNEAPDEPVLAAFSDRFLLRTRLDYVSRELIGKVLAVGWEHESRQATSDSDLPSGHDEPNEARFSLSELRKLQHEVTRIDLEPIRADLAQLINVLRNREGVALSDRRAVKAQKLIAAAALLDAREAAERTDLGVLAYLWTRNNDEETIRRVLAEHDVPVDAHVRQERNRATIIRELNRLNVADGDGGTREELRTRVQRLHELLQEATQDHSADEELLAQIKGAHANAAAALQDRFKEGTVLNV